MIGWYFLVGALALLGTVLFFGFVGCAPFSAAPDNLGADYPTTIKKTKDLVAYWRLGESPSALPGDGTGTAKDAVGGFHGYHHSYPNPITTPDNQQHSPTANGQLILGSTPGLLQLLPSSPCLALEGGWVLVPFAAQLNPPAFTLEAWVSPDPFLDKGFFYCLAQSAGPGGTGQQKTGWGLYLGPDNPAKTPPDDHFWQIWMGDGTGFNRVAIAKGTDCPTKLQLTYLALTFDGTNLQLWLYYPDTQQQLDIKHLQGAQNTKVTTFKRNDASPNGHGPVIIGAGNPLFPGGGPFSLPIYPFKGKIQEVALYKRDLSAPNNAGVQATLAAHEMTGGNL
jgi:hypothetical protein